MSTLKVTNVSPQSGSNIHITGSVIITEDLHARSFTTQITSSKILVSGSTTFGDSADDTHLFTGSVRVNGNVNANSLTGSLLSTNGVLSSSAQIATDITGSFTAASSSFASRIVDNDIDIAALTGSFSSSVSTRLTTAETELGNTLISGAAQIASEISGSSTSLSSSLASRVSTEESNVDLLQAHQGNILTFTGSADAEITALMGATSSYALSSDVVANASTASFVTNSQTGSFQLIVTSSSPVQNTYIIPVQVDCTPSGTTFLTGSFETASILRLNYSGSNGTHTLTLPDATSTTNSYRSIRVISNGTIDNQHQVDLVPSASQTLDGGTGGFTFNRSYEGVMVWSDGTEWFQIQAKNV